MANNKAYEKEYRKKADVGILDNNMSFEGTEAFNLLRTNVTFSFSDDKPCHVIAITSPVPGTGKSIIASNLAYSMAKLQDHVLLIDGDMRLPTIYDKLGLKKSPGLSNLLVSSYAGEAVIQRYNDKLDVIASGDIPPKPSELLGSARMGQVLEKLKERYSYIIVDLPPVTVVPDALAISKYVDGIVLVVRKEHDEKNALDSTIRQIEYTKVPIIGVVFNEGEKRNGTYGKYYRRYYKYGKRYYKKSYSNKYSKSYKSAVDDAAKKSDIT